jgi:hypothetical protein
MYAASQLKDDVIILTWRLTMATTRMAAGGLLSVITDVSTTISTVSNTVSNGVGILNDMVQNIKQKRQEGNIVEMLDYRDTIIENAQLNKVKREENIRAYIGQDQVKQDVFNNYGEKLREAFVKYDKGE